MERLITKRTIALVVFLAMIVIVAGLYATGPKYIWRCQSGESWAEATDGTHGCFRDDNDQFDSHGRSRYRAAAWERVWYAIVGSNSTRG